jgi:hypothetical protein
MVKPINYASRRIVFSYSSWPESSLERWPAILQNAHLSRMRHAIKGSPKISFPRLGRKQARPVSSCAFTSRPLQQPTPCLT